MILARITVSLYNNNNIFVFESKAKALISVQKLKIAQREKLLHPQRMKQFLVKISRFPGTRYQSLIAVAGGVLFSLISALRFRFLGAGQNNCSPGAASSC